MLIIELNQIFILIIEGTLHVITFNNSILLLFNVLSNKFNNISLTALNSLLLKELHNFNARKIESFELIKNKNIIS